MHLGPTFDLGPETIMKREKGVETVFRLAEIVRVRSLVLGDGGVMELASIDGRKLVVVSGRALRSRRLKEPARSDYRAFAVELHHRVATIGTAKFVRGLIFKKPYDPATIPCAVLP